MPAKARSKDAAPSNLSFHFDEAFQAYVPRLEEYADRRGLVIGPAARELVKRALDTPETPHVPPLANATGAAGLQELKDRMRGLEIAMGIALDENRSLLKSLRDELAQVLRLAFLGFKDLKESQVEELVRSVFKR